MFAHPARSLSRRRLEFLAGAAPGAQSRTPLYLFHVAQKEHVSALAAWQVYSLAVPQHSLSRKLQSMAPLLRRFDHLPRAARAPLLRLLEARGGDTSPLSESDFFAGAAVLPPFEATLARLLELVEGDYVRQDAATQHLAAAHGYKVGKGTMSEWARWGVGARLLTTDSECPAPCALRPAPCALRPAPCALRRRCRLLALAWIARPAPLPVLAAAAALRRRSKPPAPSCPVNC